MVWPFTWEEIVGVDLFVDGDHLALLLDVLQAVGDLGQLGVLRVTNLVVDEAFFTMKGQGSIFMNDLFPHAFPHNSCFGIVNYFVRIFKYVYNCVSYLICKGQPQII